MTRDDVKKDYFRWLLELIGEHEELRGPSFVMLLSYLHDTEFRYILSRDENRAEDGKDLRWQYICCVDEDIPERYLSGPCSVLEMVIALAVKCEDCLEDTSKGDRTGQWFWRMINSLGLSAMYDDRFDERYVHSVIDKLLRREYEPDGRGGLFTLRHCDHDLRYVEIWKQLCWFMNTID